MIQRLFYVCASILCLAVVYHLGAGSATAQARGQIKFIESRGAYVIVVSDTDDIYVIDPERLPQVSRGAGWWKFRLDAVK